MSELKAMALVGAGAVLLSAALDVVLLKLHVPGELLFVSLALVAVLTSLVMNRVIKHYTALDERREREEILLS